MGLRGVIEPREQIGREFVGREHERRAIAVAAGPAGVVTRGDCNVGVTELATDVAELNAGCEKLARIGVTQILHRTMSKAGAFEDSAPLAVAEVLLLQAADHERAAEVALVHTPNDPPPGRSDLASGR